METARLIMLIIRCLYNIHHQNHKGLLIYRPSLQKFVVKKSQITNKYARSRGYKTFLYSTQLSTKSILLINVKMPKIVGILTFINIKIKHLRETKQEASLFVGILVFMSS